MLMVALIIEAGTGNREVGARNEEGTQGVPLKVTPGTHVGDRQNKGYLGQKMKAFNEGYSGRLNSLNQASKVFLENLL
jgi:hypothetical protein